MKLYLSVISLFALSILIAFPLQAQQSGEDPSKCFEIVGTADYNFGTIEQDDKVDHTFIFKNNCKTVIEIDRAAASCGCTAAILSEKVIQPGSEAKIEVKFTPPKGTRGKVTKTVSVYLKGESNPHTVLRFTADVKTDLEISPTWIELRGAQVGVPTSGKISVKNVSEKDVEISDMQLTMTTYADSAVAGSTTAVPVPLNNAKVTPSTLKLKPGEQKELTVNLTPEHKGQVNGSLRLKTEKSEAWITIYGIVREKQESDVRQQ